MHEHAFVQTAVETGMADLIEIGEHTGNGDGSNVGIALAPDDAAYVMYTSGSAGEPMGIVNTHRCVVDLALDHYWHETGPLRALMQSPHAVDASNHEVWLPLVCGGTVMVAPDGRMGGSVLRGLIRAAHRHTRPFHRGAVPPYRPKRPVRLRGHGRGRPGGDGCLPRPRAGWRSTRPRVAQGDL